MADPVKIEDGKSFKVLAGRTVTIICPDCGIAHDLAISLPASLKVGVTVAHNAKVTEERRDELTRLMMGGSGPAPAPAPYRPLEKLDDIVTDPADPRLAKR